MSTLKLKVNKLLKLNLSYNYIYIYIYVKNPSKPNDMEGLLGLLPATRKAQRLLIDYLIINKKFLIDIVYVFMLFGAF